MFAPHSSVDLITEMETPSEKGVIWNEGLRMLMSFVCDSVSQKEIFKMENPSAHALAVLVYN